MVITVKALVLEKGKVLLKETPIPIVSPGELLIRVIYGGICSTDLEMVKGYVPFSGIMGHEFVGVVEKDPEGKLEGKRVVGEINISCGDCSVCRRGLKTHCPERKVPGIKNRNGVFAEYVTLPRENIFPVPEEVPDKDAVFTEPLAAGLEILEQVHIPPSSSVGILGDGKLGLLVAMVLAEAGIETIMLGNHPEKMKILKPLGIQGLIAKDFQGKMDFLVDCTGNPKGLEFALKIINPRGTIVLKTTVAEQTNLDVGVLVREEIRLIGSRCGPFGPALRLLQKGRLPVEKMIDKVFPLSRGIEAIEFAGKRGVKKVLVEMER